jgi:hypothetical protein
VIGRSAATLLRHRPPALLLDTIVACDGGQLVCSSRGVGPWRWAEMLEGAAQTAGLLAGLQQSGVDNTAVIAEYRDVMIRVARHAGPLRFTAHLDRRLLQFWRCRCEVRAADDALLLTADVTVAPGTSPGEDR